MLEKLQIMRQLKNTTDRKHGCWLSKHTCLRAESISFAPKNQVLSWIIVPRYFVLAPIKSAGIYIGHVADFAHSLFVEPSTMIALPKSRSTTAVFIIQRLIFSFFSAQYCCIVSAWAVLMPTIMTGHVLSIGTHLFLHLLPLQFLFELSLPLAQNNDLHLCFLKIVGNAIEPRTNDH